MPTILKRFPFFIALLVLLSIAYVGIQTRTVHAAPTQPTVPAGSCGDTISDDAQLFGNRVGDVLAQAQATNSSLQADTRVVTVTQAKLAGSNLHDYYYFVQSKCPNWAGQNFIVLVVAKGYDPFLHLGSAFNGKITAADFQQMTLNNRAQLTSGNYAQGSINVLQQVQKKLSPDYTWLWVTLAVLAILIIGGILAFVFLRRRQNATVETQAREQAVTAKEATINLISSLGKKSKDLSPRIEILLALLPPNTATQLHNLFETSKEKQSRAEEHLGNLLSNPATNLTGKSAQADQYAQAQRAYQQLYNEAQEPQYLLQGVGTAVDRLERNPQEPIDFRQLLASGSAQRGISQPEYS